MTPTDLAKQLAHYAEMLRDISAMGSHFAGTIYDQENYERVREISVGLMGIATATPLPQIEPLKLTQFSRPCPFPGVDAAIINDQGEMLLIQRADDQTWAMPGGASNAGETPAETAVREAYEETGAHCQPVGLAGVFDSRLHGSQSAFHLYQFVFLCRPLNQGAFDPPTHPQETVDMGWFLQETLPANLSPNHITRIPYAFAMWRGNRDTYFDLPASPLGAPG